MSAHHSGDLFRHRGALAPPQPATSIIDDANGCHFLRNVQTDEVVIMIELRWRKSPGNAARIAAISDDQAPTAITGCPHHQISSTSSVQAQYKPGISLAVRLAYS